MRPRSSLDETPSAPAYYGQGDGAPGAGQEANTVFVCLGREPGALTVIRAPERGSGLVFFLPCSRKKLLHWEEHDGHGEVASGRFQLFAVSS